MPRVAPRPHRGQRLAVVRAVPTSATGQGHDPWALVVLETGKGKVTGINSFLDTEQLFPLFGLPPHLD